MVNRRPCNFSFESGAKADAPPQVAIKKPAVIDFSGKVLL